MSDEGLMQAGQSTVDLLRGLPQRDFLLLAKSCIHNAASVLDIGCGIGDYLQYTNAHQRVVAVEPHLPYLEKSRLRVPWAIFHNTDALTFLQSTDERFDLVLLIDVVEHLEAEEAQKLVHEAIRHSCGIVLSLIPIGTHEQRHDAWNLGGEYWQTHRSTWDERSVRELGFSFVQVWKNWYMWEEGKAHKSRDTSLAMWIKNFEEQAITVQIKPDGDPTHLRRTLRSVSAQSFPVLKVKIEPPQNPDEQTVADEFVRHDTRFEYDSQQQINVRVREHNVGTSDNRSVVTLRAGDVLRPFALERRIAGNAQKNVVPIVSVVILVTEQTQYLYQALERLLVQTHSVWEAIVVASNCIPPDLTEYVERDVRIHQRAGTFNSVSDALNEGMKSAHGDYVCWLDADDLFMPEKLELQLKAFEHAGATDTIVFGRYELIDLGGNPLPLPNQVSLYLGLYLPQLLKSEYVGFSTVMFPARLIPRVCEHLSGIRRASTHVLWIYLAMDGVRLHAMEGNLVSKRIVLSPPVVHRLLVQRIETLYLIDSLLREHPFEKFYRHVDFRREEDFQKFLEQFIELISDPGAFINHPLLKKRFWEWSLKGFSHLGPVRGERILRKAARFFGEHRNRGPFYVEYARYLSKIASKEVQSMRKSPPSRQEFPPKDDEFGRLLLDYALERLRSNDVETADAALDVFVEHWSPVNEALFERFLGATFLRGQYPLFTRGFQFVHDWSQVSDRVKAFYLWAQRMLDVPEERLLPVLRTIADNTICERIERWNQAHTASLLPDASIQKWNFRLVGFAVLHELDLRCAECHQEFRWSVSLNLSLHPSCATLICPHCLAPFEFSDAHLYSYFLKHMPEEAPQKEMKSGRPKIAFVMRYSHIIGGGVKMMFKHASWLTKLGCDVTIYSDAPAPTWTPVPGKFVRLNDHYDLPKKGYDLVVVMCVYDIPKVLTKYSAARTVHFCQGYEGYHVGREYNELRSDKFFFTELHRLPVKRVVVSQHLVEFFAKKFNCESKYVPNGLNHDVFFPNPAARKEPYSLLFIGNPNEPLKGVVFLLKTLEEIQKSRQRIEGLVLHVVWGSTRRDEEIKSVDMPGYTVRYHEGLSSEEVADLINRVELVVNTSWYEGFSLPMLEAMACGTPAVTTQNMGAESFCRDGVNSFVVEYGDINRLGNIIIDVLKKRIDLTEIIRNGLETARQYSEENSMQAFVSVYAELLGKPFTEGRVAQFLSSTGLSKPQLQREKTRSQKPLFSVLVPTYNQAQYLPASLQSLIAQTDSDWEAIIVDDGSMDATPEVARRYALFDERIHYIRKPNGGVGSALNEGLKHARGEWICWLSSDDMFEPEKLALHREYIKQYPESKFFHTHYNVFLEEQGHKVPAVEIGISQMPAEDDYLLSFMYTNYINGISTCIHRSVFETVGGFSPSLRHGQDYDMWLRIASWYRPHFINHRTCVTRVHANQGTSSFPEAGIFDSARAAVLFLNQHSFTQLFPLADLTDRQQAFRAVEKTLAVAADPKSFLNQLGFSKVLIDRLHEWVSRYCPISFRPELIGQLHTVISACEHSTASEDVKEAFRSLSGVGDDNFQFKPFDPFAEAQRYVHQLERAGEYRKAYLVRRYLEWYGYRDEHQGETVATWEQLLKSGWEAYKQEEYSKAVSTLSQCLDLMARSREPRSGELVEELHVLVGECSLRLGEFERAKAVFEEALKKNPQSSAACAGLGEVFYQSELHQYAKTMFEWAVRNDPMNQRAKKRLVEVNRKLGFPAEHVQLVE